MNRRLLTILATCLAACSADEGTPSGASPVLLGTTPAGPSTERGPIVAGTSVAGASVELFTNGTCAGAAAALGRADAAGRFAIPLEVPADTTTRLSARATRNGQAACSTNAIAYVHDGTAPSAEAAWVADGTDGIVRSRTALVANWDGFTDANGIASYEHVLSTSAGCAGDLAAAVGVEGTHVERASLQLPEGARVFSCVRALDVAGNVSQWAESDGALVDGEPPRLIASDPADGARQVARRPTVRLSFSEPLAPGSLTAGAITMTTSTGSVPITATLSGAQVELTPNEPLAVETTVVVHVRPPLADLAGTACASAETRFTVRDWRFSAPAPFPVAGTGQQIGARVAATDDGTAWVLWQEVVGTLYQVFAMHGREGQWSAPEALDPGAIGYAAQLVATGAGDVFAAWTSPQAIRGAQATLAGGWGPARTVFSGSTFHLGFGAAGHAAVAARSEYSALGPRVAWNVPPGGWGAPVALNQSQVGQVSVAVAADGSATCAWESGPPGAAHVYVARLVDGVPGTPERLDTGASAHDPMVVSGRSNEAFAAWFQVSPSGFQEIWVSHRTASGWAAPVRLEENAGYEAHFALAVDASGHALVIWNQQMLSEHWRLLERHYDGQAWSEPGVVRDGFLQFHEMSPALAMGPDGRAVATWVEWADRTDTVMASRWRPGQGFAPAVKVSVGAEPSIAVDAEGRPTVAWGTTDARGGPTTNWLASWE